MKEKKYLTEEEYESIKKLNTTLRVVVVMFVVFLISAGLLFMSIKFNTVGVSEPLTQPAPELKGLYSEGILAHTGMIYLDETNSGQFEYKNYSNMTSNIDLIYDREVIVSVDNIESFEDAIGGITLPNFPEGGNRITYRVYIPEADYAKDYEVLVMETPEWRKNK